MLNNIDSLDGKKQIVIKFGNACNGACMYCSQGNRHFGESFDRYVSEDVVEWVVRWSNLFSTNIDSKDFGEIIFYGGEPLMYIAAIKDCIERLIAKGLNPKTNLWISTNGLLINEDVVDFLNSFNIEVGLSYDGRNTIKTRRRVITKYQEELFMKIKRRNILSVVNAYDWDFLDNKLYLENKFADTPVLGTLITANYDMPNELYNFKWSKIEHSLQKMLVYYSFHPVDWSFKHLVWLYIKDRDDIDDFWQSGYSGCSSGATKLSLDIEGNFLFCNNSNNKICSIYDCETAIINAYKQAMKPKLERCRCCSHGRYCRCHCPLSEEINGEYFFCDYLKKYIDLLLKYKSEFQAISDKWKRLE